MTTEIAKRGQASRGSVEAIRRSALIAAAIKALDMAGSRDVTMAAIARRADVSPALAHHYFGGKDDLMNAAMRHLLRELRAAVTRRLVAARSDRERVGAVVAGCFDPGQFSREAIAAWLIFYLDARRSPQAARLLTVYFRRLETNLTSALTPLMGRPGAVGTAQAAGAMIDGVWLRQALTPRTAPDSAGAAALLERFIDGEIARCA